MLQLCKITRRGWPLKICHRYLLQPWFAKCQILKYLSDRYNSMTKHNWNLNNSCWSIIFALNFFPNSTVQMHASEDYAQWSNTYVWNKFSKFYITFLVTTRCSYSTLNWLPIWSYRQESDQFLNPVPNYNLTTLSPLNLITCITGVICE